MSVHIKSQDGEIKQSFTNQKAVAEYLGTQGAGVSSAIKRAGTVTAKKEHAGTKFFITSDAKKPKARLIKKKEPSQNETVAPRKGKAKKVSPIEKALNNWKTFTGGTFVEFSPERVTIKALFGSGVDQTIASWCKTNKKFGCKPLQVTEDGELLIEVWREG